ncbi:Mbov_0399 family ICE element protein [Mesomycoplasma ovipneumoniae]|uniref:Mbov_0399 family ICE element protein n=1 Tax=Mesomycoplasma ovipneumoniae TaxID=29562 RepID=UPI00311C9422
MTKTTKKLSKIFLILTPFSSLVFLQSATYELPVYNNSEIKKDRVWVVKPDKTYNFTKEIDNFDFDLKQQTRNWEIFVGVDPVYDETDREEVIAGQREQKVAFSKNWFTTETLEHTGNAFDSTCERTGYNCGGHYWKKKTVPDGVYDKNHKHNQSIPDNNFEIDLEDIEHDEYGLNSLSDDSKFTDFFNLFYVGLRDVNDRGIIKHHRIFEGLGAGLKKEFKSDQQQGFNLKKIKLSFKYTVKDEKITKLSVTISAFVERKNEEDRNNEQSAALAKYFSDLQSSFKKDFPDQYVISTDSGASRGILAPKPVKTTSDTNVATLKSNREYWVETLNNWWEKAAKTNDSTIPYSAEYRWSYWPSSGDIAQVWVEFVDPLDKQRKKFWLSNPDDASKWPTQWKPTKFFLQREFSSRLELIPSTVLKYNEKLKRLVRTKAERKQIQANQQPNSSTSQTATPTNDQANVYGGEFEFVGDVKVKFNGAKDNSEVLFVNGKKIDVLDNQFETVLQDLRLEQKENGATNKYKIEIKKFKKDKSEVEKSYSIDLVTKSVVNVLQGKWFGWDPEKNLNQKKLISQYLLDDSGNEIVGQDGKKLENPKYDPNIDPQTGTKKQILWVKNNGSDLSDNIFYQDNTIGNGFIAEAAVAGKGINTTFSQNFQDDKATVKRYKIDQNQKKKFTLAPNVTTFSSSPSNKDGQDPKITNNELEYFSNSGLWLYRAGYETDQQAFKLFLIGDNDNTKLFSDIVDSEVYIPFWQSPAGKKLEKYLIKVRGFNNKYIENLSYEKLIAHWKSYINYKYDKGEIQDPISSIISKTIDQALEKHLKELTNINFLSGQTIKLQGLDFSGIEQYLTDEQKAKLKDISITPFKNGQNWAFQVDSDFRQTLGLNGGVFEFPGLKTDRELKDLKSTKKEIKVDGLEQKVQELVNKYVFVSPKELVNRVSILVNSEVGSENVATISWTTEDGVFEVELVTDGEHFIAKDQFKFNLKQLQQQAQDNYDVFNPLPKDVKANLKGITNPEQAIVEIKKQLQLLSNNQLNFGQNYSFDPKLLNNPALFNVYQGDFESAKSQGNLPLSGIDLPGYVNLDIVNVVPNISALKEKNLSKIKINDIKINSNDPQKMAEQLRDQLNKQLVPWGLNWEEYLNPGDFDKILEQIQHNKFSEISFKPSNYLTDGNLKFNVENFDFVPYNFNLPVTEETTSFIQDKKNLYWFIPLSITVLGILSFGIWFLIRKKFKKFN